MITEPGASEQFAGGAGNTDENFIAQDLREEAAKLGCRTIDEMVGRSDLLKVREDLRDATARSISPIF